MTKEGAGNTKGFDVKQLNVVFLNEITKIMYKKANELKKAYEKNPYIKEANVKYNGKTISIDLHLTFSPNDADNQNIVKVFEYGGILKKGDEFIKIMPGFYIKKVMNG